MELCVIIKNSQGMYVDILIFYFYDVMLICGK